jgi:hypothetical protein
MGIYIKGISKEQLWKVIINSTEFLPDYCEIVEVKTPHGDLIDRNVVCERIIGSVLLDKIPTVIEAEVE